VPYPWVGGEAHLVKMLTSTGTPFEHEIAVAVETPTRTRAQLAAFALIGLYVGVLPVALGLCWFPVLARLGRRASTCCSPSRSACSRSCFVDAVHEGLRGRVGARGSFQGRALFVGAAAARTSGSRTRQWLRRGARARKARPSAGSVLALLIAIGIGLHNFGRRAWRLAPPSPSAKRPSARC
jgi:hypothetical protein